MTNENRPQVGQAVWYDLTVIDKEEIRDFYSEVIDWEASSLSMGEYEDDNT